MQESGLTIEEASELLKQYGPNELPQPKSRFLKKLVAWLISPISFMLFAASILSFYSGRVFDGNFVLVLLLLNVVVGVWQEHKADTAIEKLNEHLLATVKVLRDGTWQALDSREIVPGDIVEMAIGEVIPADGKVIRAENVSVNESALTGESLPVEKKLGDGVYSGAFLATGKMTIQVSATGKNTYFGKTVFSVDKIRKKSILEQDIVRISQFLSILSIAAVVLLMGVFYLQKAPLIDLITLGLSLVIAGIPISLPTVMTLIIELGVINLAKKKVIVRRLSALEDLANVNMLLTDKTGTLTQNKITVQEVLSYDSYTEEDILFYALQASKENPKDPINNAIIEKSVAATHRHASLLVQRIIPADSVRKRSSVIGELDKKNIVISVGAPQIIAGLCELSETLQKKFDADVLRFANDGQRALAVAIHVGSHDEKHMKLTGLIALSDTVREDAREVISFMETNGISVSMVTGDNQAIAKHIADQLHISGGKIITREQLEKSDWENVSEETFHKTSAFAEILPADKLHLAQEAKKHFVVAVTGDGVNDLPALKAANVGIAVANAVAALKATADLVLLANGISFIKDAILESRKIFARIYSYSVYRISESLRLIITILILGLWYRQYPLTALQIIIIALLNDIPIIALAFDRVKLASRPSKINVTERFILSTLFGLVGVANSIILFIIMTVYMHLSWPVIQTIYFLKLIVSGHLLIFVAHTKDRWYRFFPSKEVIIATLSTPVLATFLAATGLFMPGKVPFIWIVVVWVWSLFWMQISEFMKDIQEYFVPTK